MHYVHNLFNVVCGDVSGSAAAPAPVAAAPARPRAVLRDLTGTTERTEHPLEMLKETFCPFFAVGYEANGYACERA